MEVAGTGTGGIGMSKRRAFGSVRQLHSGRWQVRYYHHGQRVSLPDTFDNRKTALAALARVESDLGRGLHVGPRTGKESLKSYSRQWMADRVLAERTRELYQGLLNRHILPVFGDDGIGEIPSSKVRSWNARLARTHPTTAAKAYRLLRTILGTAETDDLIARSPCRLDNAGTEHAPERPMATVAEVEAITAAMPERFRALILLAVWCQLRRGELLAMRRRDIDLMHGRLTVARSFQQLDNGQVVFKEPKTLAGRRRIAIPGHIVPVLGDHLARFVTKSPDALVFTGEKGGVVRPSVLHAHWAKARLSAGRPDLHLHDLRHTGNTWAAATGASTKELMARMGHSSPRAALVYQHATEDRDRVIADALADLATPAQIVPLKHLGHG
jgi:integrase